MLLVEALNLSLSRINKHTLSWNIPVRTKETDNVTAIIEQPATGTKRPKTTVHELLFDSPSESNSAVQCSAVDCFLELNYAVFKNFIRRTELNEFFEVLNEACL